MMNMRICRRCPPFGEHRDMAEVLETEELEKRRRLGKLTAGEYGRLVSLQSRAVLPPDPEPPAAA